MKPLLQMLQTAISGDKKGICALSMESQADLQTVKGLIEDGALRAFIDKEYPLTQIAAAHAALEGRPKQGAVAITLAEA